MTDLVEKVARAIEPEWFGELIGPPWWSGGAPRHPLDNYPQQYEGYRLKAREQAKAVIPIVLEEAAKVAEEAPLGHAPSTHASIIRAAIRDLAPK